MRFLAVFGAVRAEAREVELADLFADVLFGTDGPEGAEAFFVVWARG